MKFQALPYSTDQCFSKGNVCCSLPLHNSIQRQQQHTSVQPLIIECSLHYTHIWKLAGFFYPLYMQLELDPHRDPGGQSSQLASLESACSGYHYVKNLLCTQRSDALFVNTGQSTCILFGVSLQCINSMMNSLCSMSIGLQTWFVG